MGFGSLRATLYHMAFAERLWLDRWQSKPWAPLAHDWSGVSLDQITRQFSDVARERNVLIAREAASRFERMVDYANSAREPFRHRLRELLLHVVNHNIHHRAQALNFLRRQARTAPGGLDYLFFKLAEPTVPSDTPSLQALRSYGLDIGGPSGAPPTFDPQLIRRYCEYGNWVTDVVLELARPLANEELDRSFEMGMGSLRKNLRHMIEAEQWWYRNWTEGPSPFPKLPETLSIDELSETWREATRRRDAWLSQQSVGDLAKSVTAAPAGVLIQIRVGESFLQLCGHGTHHRAQAINMLRQIGLKPPSIDYVVWLRGPGAVD
jgi:uncharacterized damage-inducible protein DinB